MGHVVDLRSDTLTQATPEMRRAMAEAVVGDDVFGEDPGVNSLEAMAAAIAGKEAALFVPSGTMANQIAIRSQTGHGDEVLVEAGSHSFNFEAGAPAALSGVQIRPLSGERGAFSAQQVAACLRRPDDHFAPVRLVIMENTHNRAGGAIYPLAEMRRIHDLCHERGLAAHIDGARIFNASVASGIALADYAACADTLSFCFSKGLGAPVGSVLTGTKEVIGRARRYRKMFGGSMRQAGHLAAAAIHALEHHVERLAEDHARARRLAQGIAPLPGLTLVNDPPDTNMLMVETAGRPGSPETDATAPAVCAALKDLDVLALPVSTTRIRLVVHLDVSDADIEQAIEAFGRILTR